jgi:hypothetical protein
MAHGFSINGSYTWSKSLDDLATPLNVYAPLSNERAISSFDRTHVFTASYIWEIPFARGLTGLGRKVLDGWQISGITSIQSGNPITPVITGDRAGTGAGSQRPNVSGPIGTPNTQFQWFDTGVFALPAAGTFGNAGRALVRGPGFANTDLSFSKRTAITESIALQFRAEFFNIFNHTQWASVGATVGSGTFGQVVSARDPRITQLGLRLTF